MPEYEYIVRFSEPDNPSGWNYIGSTHGRSTTAADTPASTYIPPALASVPGFALSIFDGIEPVLNPRGSFGAVVLNDPTGVLDSIVGSAQVTDGGILELRRGLPSALHSAFTTVATLATAGLLYDHDAKRFRLHNLGRILETAALHDDVYGGTGSADGDATLAGVLKPYCIGRVFNIPATLINASLLIYQVSCTPIQAIDAVREGGAAITASATDRANYAAMAATAPAAGQYDTCIAEGLIRLGASPTLGITCDVKGDKTSGTYFEKRGDIAKQIVIRAGSALTSGQVDATALSALNTAKTATCGYFWNQPITKAQALSEVMEGCLGFWWINLSGSLMLDYLYAPGSSPVATYAFPDRVGIPVHDDVVQAPRWNTSLGYQRNYTIQEGSQLAGAVSAADRLLYGQDAQRKFEETTANKAKYPTALDKRLNSGIWSGSDAQTEATTQQGMMDGVNQRWRVPIYEDPFVLAALVGQRIAISGYTRYGWSNPRTFILIGVEWGGSLVPTATLWGAG